MSAFTLNSSNANHALMEEDTDKPGALGTFYYSGSFPWVLIFF